MTADPRPLVFVPPPRLTPAARLALKAIAEAMARAAAEEDHEQR